MSDAEAEPAADAAGDEEAKSVLGDAGADDGRDTRRLLLQAGALPPLLALFESNTHDDSRAAIGEAASSAAAGSTGD